MSGSPSVISQERSFFLAQVYWVGLSLSHDVIVHFFASWFVARYPSLFALLSHIVVWDGCYRRSLWYSGHPLEGEAEGLMGCTLICAII